MKTILFCFLSLAMMQGVCTYDNPHFASASPSCPPDAVSLHIAARRGYTDCVIDMLAKGSDPNQPDSMGLAPLHYAVMANRLEIVKILTDHGANIEARAPYAGTPFALASVGKYFDIMGYLLSKGANPDAPGLSDMPPIHNAVMGNEFKTVEYLLQHGAKVNARSAIGDTPLHIVDTSMAIVFLLIDYGVDVWAKNGLGMTAFQQSSLVRKNKLMGQRLYVLTTEVGSIQQACKNKDMKRVQKLIAAGVDLNSHDQNGWTAAHYAAGNDKPEILALLLDHGADPNQIEKNGFSALHLAARQGQVANMELLLRHRANINQDANQFGTPLHIAVASKQSKSVEWLAAHKANLNARDKSGTTPMGLAVGMHDWDRIQILLDAGADPNVRDNRGHSPLEYAGTIDPPLYKKMQQHLALKK